LIRFGSVATGVHESDVAGFAAFRAIVQAVHAQANFVHALADGAVAFAGALIFGFIALHAEDRSRGHHSLLKKTLPERAGLRQGRF
jgi:hypothetical protein